MNAKSIRLVVIIAGVLLSLSLLTAETICEPPLRLKPVRCICGRLTDPTGGRIPETVLAVLRDGVVVATATSGKDGKFQFGELKAGNYELAVQSTVWLQFKYPIVVTKPENRCRRGLEILLEVGGENCGSRVTKQ